MGSLNTIMLKKTTFLIFFVSAFVFATSSAGRALVHNLAKELHAIHHEKLSQDEMAVHKESANIVHERLLRTNTKDYGNYDPAPALAKPPFKLIPN